MSGKGFTLIELVTALVIVALLSTLAIPAYLEYRTDAKQSSEKAVVGAVRTAIHNQHAKSEISGDAAWPANLDTAAANASASSTSPFFSLVLNTPVTDNWKKGAATNTYVGPTETTYYYDPETGRFATDLPASMVEESLAAQIADFTNQRYYTAGVDETGKWYGTGYVVNADGTVSLAVAGNSWAARALVQAIDMPTAGDYAFDVTYRLTDYYTQLHYWQVIGIKDGVKMDLASASDTSYFLNKSGTGIVYQEYSRDGQDNGQWVTQNNKFTVTQEMTTKYDQLLIQLVASERVGQTADWGNVTGTLPGLAPMK